MKINKFIKIFLIVLVCINISFLTSCKKVIEKAEGYAYRGNISNYESYDNLRYEVEILLNIDGTYEISSGLYYENNGEIASSNTSMKQTHTFSKEEFILNDENKEKYSYISETTLDLSDIDYLYVLKNTGVLLKDNETGKCVLNFNHRDIFSKVLELDSYEVPVFDKKFYKNNKLYIRTDYSVDNIIQTYRRDNCYFILNNNNNKITKINSYILKDDVYDCVVNHNYIRLYKNNESLSASFFFNNKDLALIDGNKRENYIENKENFSLNYLSLLPPTKNL